MGDLLGRHGARLMLGDGDFGVEHPPLDESFMFFGEEIRINPDLTDVAMIEAIAALQDRDGETLTGQTTRASDAIGLYRDLLGVYLHPEDTETFWTLFSRHRQTIADLMALSKRLAELITQRPTLRPSDSFDGPLIIDTKSEDVSSSQAVRLLEDRGRPDLAVAVRRAERALQPA